MSFATEREEDFAECVRDWGIPLTRNGVTCQGTKTPDVVDKLMQATNYQSDVRATFRVLRADYDRLRLTLRAQFGSGGVMYEVFRYRDNAADSTVKFDAIKLK